MQPDRGGSPDVEDRGRDFTSPTPVPAPRAGVPRAADLPVTGTEMTSGDDRPSPRPDDEEAAPERPQVKGIVLLVCLLLAFRGALLVQQAALFASLSATGCGPGIELNGISPSVTGLEACGDAGLTAAIVGTFAGIAVAVPILLWFPCKATTVPRALAAFLYLLSLASVAEVVSGSFVMSIMGRFEAGRAVEIGVPLAAFVVAGLGFAAACFPTLKKTASTFVVDVLHHDEKHVGLMEKAVVFKLTAGVVVISLVRILTGG